MAKEEVREVNPNVHWYSLRDLMSKFPIQNKRWQLSDGGVSFEYFYDLMNTLKLIRGIANLLWVRTGQTEINDWLHTETKGTYYRLTSVQGKRLLCGCIHHLIIHYSNEY